MDGRLYLAYPKDSNAASQAGDEQFDENSPDIVSVCYQSDECVDMIFVWMPHICVLFIYLFTAGLVTRLLVVVLAEVHARPLRNHPRGFLQGDQLL